MNVSLIITSYNRPSLLKKCLQSVREALKNESAYPIIIDDSSTDDEIPEIIMSCGFPYLVNDRNIGIKNNLLYGFEFCFEKRADLCINLDGDAIVKPEFITRLKDLKKRFPDRIISGFNCNHPKNPVLFDGADYVERKHANGINMCINRNDYENIVRPALLSQKSNWDYASTNSKNFIITKGSVVQHLGADCSTLGHVGGDVACDF